MRIIGKGHRGVIVWRKTQPDRYVAESVERPHSPVVHLNMGKRLFRLRVKRERKFPVPLEDVDLSGRIKMETLEEILYEQSEKGWCSSKYMYKNSFGIDHRYKSRSKCISIRFLRYYRAGLLKRQRRGRGFVYNLSEKGEDRLLYFWEKFRRLEPPSDWMMKGRLGELEKRLAEMRRRYQLELLETKLRRSEKVLRSLN